MHRFYVAAGLLSEEELTLPRETAQQILRVLRLRVGAEIGLFCGDGDECVAVISAVTSSTVQVRVVRRARPEVELPGELRVVVAVLKGEKLDWVVQKLTELGVSRITFLSTERTVVSAGEERWSRRLERYGRIVAEAAEQSGRVRVPAVEGPLRLPEVLAGAGGRTLFLDPLAAERFTTAYPVRAPLTLLIGPEGGFTAEEAAAAREAGAEPVRLGPRILRAETAAITAAAVAAIALETLQTGC